MREKHGVSGVSICGDDDAATGSSVLSVEVIDGRNETVILKLSKCYPARLMPDEARAVAQYLMAAADRVTKPTE